MQKYLSLTLFSVLGAVASPHTAPAQLIAAAESGCEASHCGRALATGGQDSAATAHRAQVSRLSWSPNSKSTSPLLVTAETALHTGADLRGIWQQDEGSNTPGKSPLIKILIEQSGNQLLGLNLEFQFAVSVGYPFLKGIYSSPDSFRVELKGFTDRGLVQWFSGTLTVRDSDHFQILENKMIFRKISTITPGEMPCDPGNRAHVTGPDALARGWLDNSLKNDAEAACWYRVAADQGEVTAQINYASSLVFGTGVAKDIPKAVPWIQKSAMQNEYGAASDLAYMFGSGVGVPKSAQRAKYWKARADLNDPDFVHRSDFLPIPGWASQTAGPCDPSNPSHANAAQALNAGRVAYEARALDTAACWFHISQSQGNIRASVYMGILSMFGLGMEKDQAAGFAYMTKAANANDAFALMYLANFFRYGIGTRPDQNQASALVQRALRAPDGLDTFMRVQGTLLSTSEAVTAAAGGISADQEERACMQMTPEQKQKNNMPANCSESSDWFIGLMARPANHTVEHIEEILPENFDPAVPPDQLVLKQAARLGLTQ